MNYNQILPVEVEVLIEYINFRRVQDRKCCQDGRNQETTEGLYVGVKRGRRSDGDNRPD